MYDPRKILYSGAVLFRTRPWQAGSLTSHCRCGFLRKLLRSADFTRSQFSRPSRTMRMVEGFGVHSFRLINTAGESTFVKFHWRPKLGIQSTVWDEAVKLAGADPDFHRRDLWEAIEAGEYPEWELAFQLFSEEQAEQFSFDVLDATKLIPEELVPLTPVG
eukprot:gene55320-73886_t